LPKYSSSAIGWRSAFLFSVLGIGKQWLVGSKRTPLLERCTGVSWLLRNEKIILCRQHT